MQLVQLLCLLLVTIISCAGAPSLLVKNQSGLVSSDRLSPAMLCKFCRAASSVARFSVRLGFSDDHIASAVISVCEEFGVEDNKVCKGAINLFKNEVLTVLKHTELSSEEICALTLGVCSEEGDSEIDWRVVLPHTKKPPVQKLYLPKPGSPTLRILHLSDAHLDLHYKPGSSVTCKEPLCCRKTDGTPATGSNKAGYWGEAAYCDLPLHTFMNMLEHLKKEKFDMIYWTGDLPAHNVWNQTEEGQMKLIDLLSKALSQHFPDTPIYSALGNHESVPVDSFPPPFVNGKNSISWLYNKLAEDWVSWVPPSQISNIQHGAFYTVLIKPGFRLISINTNYCNRMNIWLLLNSTDPSNELKWLITVLQHAEDKKEKVHIIGHIPPGTGDCYTVWTANYHAIVNRYESTITGQFFGHTHFDHFEIFYDKITKNRAVSVAYIAPSITTFDSLNPGYRIYTVDGFYPESSWYVLDHETHILNVTEANRSNKPVWEKEYSALQAYKMTDLFPQSWDNLASQMLNDNTQFNAFYRYYFKSNPLAVCDRNCQRAMVCSLKTSISKDTSMC